MRDGKGKGAARKLRAQGKLPAVVYGASTEPLSVALNTHEADLLFRSISVENTIVNLEVDGESAPFPTLVREIQTHPYRPQILHVDFLRIQSGVEVELEVPLHFTGTAKGVKDDGGVLDQPIHNLPIRCVPDRIPEEILVDVSALEIGDALHIYDLALPEGVTVLLDTKRIVCSVQPPTILVVETPTEEGAEGEGEAAEGETKAEGAKAGEDKEEKDE
jgi:large subunit ribosomal protein L25